MLSNDGKAGWRSEYDARGHLVKLIAFGIDGNPTTTNDGYAGAAFSYDASGNRTGITLLDCDGNEL